MKKIILLCLSVLLLASCQKETALENTTSQNLNFDTASMNNNIGVYKGVFTTLDAEKRAIVEVIMTDANTFAATYGQNATATLTFEDGTIATATAAKTFEIGEAIVDLAFASSELSFLFSVESDGNNPSITDVVYKSKSSDILIAKHSTRDPILPILGTFTCTACNGHPNVNNATMQTFNINITSPGAASSAISTQTTVAGASFLGAGTQNMITSNADGTSTAQISGSFDVVAGTSVTYTGTHRFSNVGGVVPDCSEVQGNWSWATNNFGTLTGTFISNNDCSPAVFVHDFESPMPTWPMTPSITYFNVGADVFSPILIGGADGSTNITRPTIIDNTFLFVRDLQNNNGGTTGGPATLTFDSIAVDPTKSSTITFEYDVIGFDAADQVDYIVVLNDVDQTQQVLIAGVNGGGETAQGVETINIPAGNLSVGFKLLITQNGGTDYAGFDNFTLTIN